MPDIEQNLEVWKSWNWSQAGDEWSRWWGGTPALWFGALLPRLHAFIPTSTILEIGPGYGRWTQYLKEACDRLVIVDLAEQCVDHCRERFADSTNIEYHVNDGLSLEMIADESVDVAFSFDSLVHAEPAVLEAYVGQLARKLHPDGIGLFHHSNAGRYRALSKLATRLPERLRRRLVNRGVLIDIYAWRDEDTTTEGFAEVCERANLACVWQEEITWERGRYLTDTISIFTRPGSRWDRPRATFRNRRFAQEGERTALGYALSSFPRAQTPSS
jgi:SAM-dependent methyltransferase